MWRLLGGVGLGGNTSSEESPEKINNEMQSIDHSDDLISLLEGGNVSPKKTFQAFKKPPSAGNHVNVQAKPRIRSLGEPLPVHAQRPMGVINADEIKTRRFMENLKRIEKQCSVLNEELTQLKVEKVNAEQQKKHEQQRAQSLIEQMANLEDNLNQQKESTGRWTREAEEVAGDLLDSEIVLSALHKERDELERKCYELQRIAFSSKQASEKAAMALIQEQEAHREALRRAASNNDRQVAELMREQMGIQRELQDALREAKIEEKKISRALEEANNTVKQLKVSLKNSETAREASENKVKTEAVKAAASASKEAEAKAAINAEATAKAANISFEEEKNRLKTLLEERVATLEGNLAASQKRCGELAAAAAAARSHASSLESSFHLRLNAGLQEVRESQASDTAAAIATAVEEEAKKAATDAQAAKQVRDEVVAAVIAEKDEALAAATQAQHKVTEAEVALSRAQDEAATLRNSLNVALKEASTSKNVVEALKVQRDRLHDSAEEIQKRLDNSMVQMAEMRANVERAAESEATAEKRIAAIEESHGQVTKLLETVTAERDTVVAAAAALQEENAIAAMEAKKVTTDLEIKARAVEEKLRDDASREAAECAAARRRADYLSEQLQVSEMELGIAREFSDKVEKEAAELSYRLLSAQVAEQEAISELEMQAGAHECAEDRCERLEMQVGEALVVGEELRTEMEQLRRKLADEEALTKAKIENISRIEGQCK